MSKNLRRTVLQSAEKAVCKGRNVAYGEPEDNFTRIRRLINAHLKNRFGEEAPQLENHDVAQIGLFFKQGRLAFNPEHLDSWIDVAGYAACGAEVTKAR